MDFTIEVRYNNELVITNNDVVTIDYGLQELNSTGTLFVNFGIYTNVPNIPILSGATATILLPKDNLYKVYIEDIDTENITTYYVSATHNLKQCHIGFIKQQLCSGCGCADKYEHMKQIEKSLEFFNLYMMLLFKYNILAQSQSITNFYTPSSEDLLYYADLIKRLDVICNCGCNDKVSTIKISDCGC